MNREQKCQVIFPLTIELKCFRYNLQVDYYTEFISEL